MPELTGPPVAECATWLSIVSQLFGTRMQSLLEPHGLTQGQFSILHHITRHRPKDGSRISDIAAAVQVRQPAVTKAVAKFQNLGLIDVVDSAVDKRSKRVLARPEAQALLEQIYADIGPDLMQVFGAIEATDVPLFTQQLKHLGVWLDQNRLDG